MSEHVVCERRIDRVEKKAAAANRENEALRAEVRKLRHANFILQRNLEGLPASGYKVRYEKLVETIGIIREMARADVNGIPDGAPKTLEPWLGPAWARKRSASETEADA